MQPNDLLSTLGIYLSVTSEWKYTPFYPWFHNDQVKAVRCFSLFYSHSKKSWNQRSENQKMRKKHLEIPYIGEVSGIQLMILPVPKHPCHSHRPYLVEQSHDQRTVETSQSLVPPWVTSTIFPVICAISISSV